MQRITAILALLLVVVVGCNDGESAGDGAPSTQSRLESAVASDATSFDFAADPTFKWDRLFVFDCYSNQASVEQSLGFKWPDFRRTTIESSDSVLLVVFLSNGKVADWYEQPRKIDLSGLANTTGYSRSQTKFRIDRATGRTELQPSKPATSPTTPQTLRQRIESSRPFREN